jgi:uncharacterized protein
MTVAQALLDLQTIDTTTDQLNRRRATSPVREAFTVATERVRTWEQRRSELTARIEELTAAIESAESRSATLLTQRQRLEQQLRTVIAPREAEALMHEIATVEAQRDELDDEELTALEEQGAVEEQLQRHLAEREAVAEAARQADAALAEETGDIDVELAALEARRSAARDAVPADLLATYDRKRAALGVAVASLVGKQCQGCHLELSAAEVDTVKQEAAATGVTDCPDCGRLLVVTAR